MAKPKVAFYWCASCGGCEETVVDLKCKRCGLCVTACPAGATTIKDNFLETVTNAYASL